LLSEFINQSQYSDLNAILQLIMNGIPTPNMIGMRGSLPLPRRESQPPCPSLLLTHLEPFPATDSLHTFAIDPVAIHPSNHNLQ
jgi:hypothetical protein